MCEDNWHFFTIYKASARHPELRNILRRRGSGREFIEFCAGRQRDTRLGDWTRTTLRGIGTISGDLVAPVKTVNGNSNLAVLWPCQTSSAGLAGSSYLCCKGVSLGKQAMAAGKLVRQIVIARAPTPSSSDGPGPQPR